MNKLSMPIRQLTQPISSKDDDTPTLDFTSSGKQIAHPSVEQANTFVGHGGEFGGAGASAHWGDSQSNSNCGNDSPPPSSDSSSSSGGGD